tara:strand:- start:9168 stop:10805 length:1638 start_codon:yes stop_codon:yes gene_type:complete
MLIVTKAPACVCNKLPIQQNHSKAVFTLSLTKNRSFREIAMRRLPLTLLSALIVVSTALSPSLIQAEESKVKKLTGIFKRDGDSKESKKEIKASKRPDLRALFAENETQTLLEKFWGENKQLEVEDEWHQLIQEHSRTARQYNQSALYANPNIQAFVNNLGQSLIPREADREVILTFKILQDPVPEVYALSTGTVFITTGMLSMMENESQLAFVLAHEAGHILANHHLLEVVTQNKKETRSKLTGMVLNAMSDSGVASGEEAFLAAAIYGMASAYGSVKFSEKLEKEADLIALELTLRHEYDIRDSESLIAELGRISRNSSPEVGLSFASNPYMLEKRAKTIGTHLKVAFQPAIDKVLDQEGFKLASPRYNQLMSEVKRDNGYWALQSDLFAIAKSNLESAAEIRTDDPYTMYSLGLLYRAIARSPEDRFKAVRYFKSAVQFDSGRHQFPAAHLQYAVELINMDDPGVSTEIQHHLKTYVTLFQRQNKGNLPPEMHFVYDYLALSGEKGWVALPVTNISTGYPYQYTGDASIDTLSSTPLKSGKL